MDGCGQGAPQQEQPSSGGGSSKAHPGAEARRPQQGQRSPADEGLGYPQRGASPRRPSEERRAGSLNLLLQGSWHQQSRPAKDGAGRPWREQAARAGSKTPGGDKRPLPGCAPCLRREPALRAQHRARGIGLNFLENLVQKDPSEVAITLASSTGLREVLSQTAMGPRFLQLLCQVLRRACLSRLDRQSIQQLLGAVKESNFLRVCLPQYVVGMQLEAAPAVRHQCPEHIGNILGLVQELVSIFPASSVQSVAMVMAVLPASVNALRASGVEFTEETENNLEKVQTFIQHLQEKRREGTLRVDSCTLMQSPAPGQEEYRTIPIYPTYNEVHLGETVSLRPNIISQAYESPTVYLDTHFRLLREDFVRPLREGILQLLRSFEDQTLRKKRFDNILVYFDARIVAPLCSPTGIDYKVAFDTKPLKLVRWENSKRLLYGSLVCMSKDHFETFLFATVSHRESQDLQKGFVHLSFDKNSRALLAEVQPSDTFVMVETTAYFEAYRHVLERLQEIREEDLPFQKYIVQCEPHLKEPAYLVGGSTYDLGCLMRDAAAGVQGAPEAPQNPRKTCVNILDPQQWPTMEALSLDESQMQALQLALTKELAIIQGPPGTGKTYVGLKIVEALLSNKAVQEKSPILVVCYTNHALDQFLEGIYTFQKTDIVRVGGRSSSLTLKKFSLQELRKQGVFRGQETPRHLRWGYNDVTRELREAEQELHECAALLEACSRGVLHERHLRSHMSRRHWNSLLQGWDEALWMNPKNCSLVQEWLGLGITPFVQGGAVDLNGLGNAGTLEEEEEGPETDTDLLVIAEEADLIQAERLLDQDEGGFPRLRKRDSRRAAAELADRLLAVKLEEEEGGPQSSEDAGWEVQRGQKKKMKQRAKDELRKPQAMTEAEAEAVQNVWQLEVGSRWKLYRYWLQKYQAEIRRETLSHEEKYQAAAERLAELRLQEDRCILETAQVVGMTTTGAARYHHILQQVAPRVVIVEEAAEVLEAHTITTLSKSCQHLILIGDHQQLRPSANVYDLAKNFCLEVSLFERLVKVGLPFVRLNFQHRMRPEIAQLLTPHIYQHLENHPSVLQYENIKGVSSNLFFVEHNFPEQQLQEGKSHQNQHEAHFVVALCKYFLCQDYLPSQITILTTYTGQLFCLRNLLPAKTFQGVKVHVVDKYQGEENDLILLSLVRSNVEERVGFLQIANRICVALSRARKGLFCIGNMTMLSKVPLWSKIIHTLREKGHIGRALLLSCQNHPGTQTEVAQAADFDKVPEGGCSRPCDCRLSCGHVCPRACHPYDPQHTAFRCMKPCQKVLCGDGHRCPGPCWEPCGQCRVEVAKVLPRCGHQQKVPCFMPAEAFCCQEPCGRVLTCGHGCRLTCGQECTSRRCPEKVLVTLKCGHSQSVSCSAAADMEEGGNPVPCETKCPSTLECGHQCPGSCNSCSNGRFHEQCSSPCKRPLICSHECLQPCTRECPPCPRPCQTRCVHSRCPKTCGEPCVPCVEPCEWRCQHYQCGRLCSEPCDRPRCNEPCPKSLPCGHPCAGVCGELCPKKCPVCDRDELTQIFFGFEDEPGARFVQLEDCGHVFETQGLDHYMGQGTDAAVQLKVCPACQTPIRKNLRYSTLVKRSLADIEVVKKRIRGCPEEIAAGARRLEAVLQAKATLRCRVPKPYWQLMQKLAEPALSLGSLMLVEQLLTFYGRLAKLMGAMRKLEPSQQEGAKRRLGEVGRWLERPRTNFTPQELSELQSEFQRLTYLLDLLAKVKAAQGKMAASTADLVSAAQQVLESPGKFTPEDERLVRTKMEALEDVLPKGGLGISEEERVQIVAAVTGTTRGHWFKCPNGHIYVIGNCGGAMEKSRCPECQEVIGGTNHTLEPSNQLAPEMDGATHAAWSAAANNLHGAGLRFFY